MLRLTTVLAAVTSGRSPRVLLAVTSARSSCVRATCRRKVGVRQGRLYCSGKKMSEAGSLAYIRVSAKCFSLPNLFESILL